MVWASKRAVGVAAGKERARQSQRIRGTSHSILGVSRMKKIVLLSMAAVSMAAAQTNHLSDFRQLTHGGQNAEAYWSPDSKRLIFQTTRSPYECDQIFVMNADGSDQHLVSTGKGRTTCGYFYPDGKHVLYASTHESGAECPPGVDRSKGYLWPVYESFEIYKATL